MNLAKQIFFFTALSLAGCSSSSSPSQTSKVDVKMTVVSEDILEVGFSLSKPTTEIFLRRTPDEKRLDRWVSNSHDFSIYHVDGRDSIRRKDGKVFSEAVFDVPMTYYAPPHDYAPFMPFKEGGVLIHSARYQSCTVPCADETAPSRFKMKIIPPLEDHVILFGKVLENKGAWEDTLSGTMIYVGGATPTLTEDVVTVIDSSLPEKVRGPLERFFPQLMKYYSNQFGNLETKPMLLLHWISCLALIITQIVVHIQQRAGFFLIKCLCIFLGMLGLKRDLCLTTKSLISYLGILHMRQHIFIRHSQIMM